MDHCTGYLHVEHQLGLSAVETIRAKQNYEKIALDHGVVVESYLTDSGAFKANAFVHHIRNHEQRIRYCGANAHHKNGIAERSIQSVSNMVRALILHASAHWTNGIDASLWPMAVTYATHLYNHLPNERGLCPADLFTGSTAPWHCLKDLHLWGCPVYILDPQLQAGQKLPQWQPQSCCDVFLGISNLHSSEVPLVLNLQTGSITPQFYVIFDYPFSTVNSITREEEPPEHWEALCLENSTYIPTDISENSVLYLEDNWLTPPELAQKQHNTNCTNRIHKTFVPTDPNPHPFTVASVMSEGALTTEGVPISTPAVLTPVTETPLVAVPTHPIAPVPVLAPAQPFVVRCSTHSNKGTNSKTRYIDEVFLSQVMLDMDSQSHCSQLAYADRKSTRLNSSHQCLSRMPSSA